MIQNGMNIDLVEIKSGKDYKKHTTLDKILAVDEWTFNRAYVFCKGNIESYVDVVYLPWYQIMFFKPDAIPKGLKYEVDISNLI
ncbi:MAG: hypothetical protein GX796_07325 [Clostridiaceae bacterium]|nr:hypothetical protein [Clostridiaceae bacterium]